MIKNSIQVLIELGFRIPRALYLISSKILEISNSFLFVVDKEIMKLFVEFFHNFRFSDL